MNRVSISQGQSEKLLRLQRDLGMALSTTSEQIEALNLILDATCRIEGIDCGGIYLFDKTTGDLNLMVHRGLPADFIEMASHYSPDSPQVQLVMSAKPIYGLFPQITSAKDAVCRDEGLRALAVIPVLDKLTVIGTLNLASHHHDEIPADARCAIESIASQIGGVFGRLEAEASLRESQKDLKELFDSLEDFFFIFDSNGNVLSINPTVEKRLGYRPENLSSMHVLDLHPEERRAEAAAIIKEMMIGKVVS